MVQRTYGQGPLGGLALIVCSVHARMLVVDGTEAVRYPWVSLCFYISVQRPEGGYSGGYDDNDYCMHTAACTTLHARTLLHAQQVGCNWFARTPG